MAVLFVFWGVPLSGTRTFGRYRVLYDNNDGFRIVDDNDVDVPDESGSDDPPTRLTIVHRVAHARFDGAGWPEGRMPEASLPTIPTAFPDDLVILPEGPKTFDSFGGNDREVAKLAFQRLARACATPGGFVQLVRSDTRPSCHWLSFKLPLLDLRLLDALPREPIGVARTIEAAGAGLPNGSGGVSENVRQAIRSARLLAERSTAEGRRFSYLTAGFRHVRDGAPYGKFEFFGANATALPVLGHVPTGNVKLDSPSKDDRWGIVADKADGFWWAENGGDPANQHNLDDAFAFLQCIPTKPGNASSRPVRTRLGGTGNPVAPALDLLKWVGLEAAEAAVQGPVADCAGGVSPPYHNLSMRLIGETEIEWRRWIRLASPADPAQSSPAMLRVLRQQAPANGAARVVMSIEGLTSAQVLAIWSRHVAAPLRAERRRAGDTNGLTLVPDLVGIDENSGAGLDNDRDGGGAWCLELSGSETWNLPAGGSPLSRYGLAKARLFRMASGRVATGRLLDSPVPQPAAFVPFGVGRLVFPDLLTHGSHPIEIRLKVDPTRPVLTIEGAGVLEFGIAPDGAWRLTTSHKLLFGGAATDPQAPGQLFAVGGLDLKLAENKPIGDFNLRIEASATRRDYEIGPGDRSLILPLAEVTVGGADRQIDDLETKPLLWGKQFMSGGELLAADRRSPYGGRSFTLALAPPMQTGTVDRFSVTLVDPSPMLVAKVEADKLSAPTSTRSIAATWDASEGLWRLVRLSEKVPEITITLPPQGVAEAWESSKTAGADQIPDGARVPARLTSSALFAVEADERARNPVAPWNLRALMGFSQDDLPGARMARIERLETLYGLQASVSVTALAGMRMAELAGWRGVPREPLLPTDAAGEAGKRASTWQRGISAWKRRLAVLDVRPEADPLARPRIAGAHFQLRLGDADAVPGPNDPMVPGKFVAPPSLGGADPEYWTEGKDGGIQGGALAGFEQKEAIEVLLREAPYGVGEIDGLQLSALGAWAKPRAAFDNGLSLISADLQMGRVHEARFERKGRIGALHHLAKHVIVYRRSFAATAQFAGEQQSHKARPIVRKAEEYVEITQPLRSYPDSAGGTAVDAGPVLGARFRTIRIPVHGGWAERLRDPRVEGYALPLWRADADPVLYPKPVVEMLLAGDPARSEPEPLARRVESADRLRFYTVTRMNVGDPRPPADVDSWPLIYDFDFVDRVVDDPTTAAEPIRRRDFQAGDDPSAKLPPAPEAAPGLERFTLLLEAGPAVNVMQARASKPALADIRSVLMMRARHVAAAAGPAPAPLDLAVDLAALGPAVPAVAALSGLARTASDMNQIRQDALAGIADLRARMARFKARNDLKEQVCDWAHAPAKWLDQARAPLADVARLDTLWSQGSATIVAVLDRASMGLRGLVPLEGQAAKFLTPVIDQATDALDRSEREIMAAIAEARSKLDAAVTEWKDRIVDGLAAKARALETAIGTWSPDIGPARQALARYRSEVASAARQASDRAATIRGAVAKVDDLVQRLRDTAARVERVAPAPARTLRAAAETIQATRTLFLERLAGLERDVAKALASADDGLAAWERAAARAQTGVDALRRKAATAIGEVAAKIEDAANGAVKVAESATALGAEIGTTLTAELFRSLRKAVEEARAEVTGAATAALAQADAEVRNAANLVDRLRAHVGDAQPPAELAALQQAATRVDAALATVGGEIAAAGDDLCAFLEQADAVANGYIADWDGKLNALANAVATIDLERFRAQVEGIESAFRQTRQGVEDLLDGEILRRLGQEPVAPQTLGQAAALNLLRAAGAPPIVEQMLFNRDRIAYHFRSELDRVVVTPVTALVDQVDQTLRGVGVTLPTLGIGETLLAPANAAFNDLRESVTGPFKRLGDDLQMRADEVLRDFAGLKRLLPSLKFDSRLAEAIKVTHDYDSSRRVAWLQVDVKHGPDTQDLFRQSGFAIRAEKMVLSGTSRYERGLSGGESRTVKASIVSDWVLIIGGLPLVRIRDAAIRYDGSSGMRFDIRPENIEFPGALQLLTQLLKKYSGGGNGLVLELLHDPSSGKPIGLRSRYDLPPVAIEAGALSIFNAALGVHLDLAQRAEFEIRSFAYFGRRDSPFAITVNLLGGGGYVEAEAIHRPSSRRTDLALRVSIGATAGRGFSLGPLRGSIQVYLGFEATFLSNAAGSQIAVAAIFVLSGSVTAWGFVTVDLGVRLSLTYNGQQIVGYGEVKVSVRISRFYRKSFSRSITYKP